MAKRSRARSTSNSNLERSTSWSGLTEGDQVVVDAPKERRLNFVFVAYVRHLVSGDEWVEVRGGRRGEAKDRSFRPELIYPVSSRVGSRIGGPSIVEAPRLPFG